MTSLLNDIRSHQFHPVRDGFTYDRHLNTHGVADLNDPDGRIRLLAIRDLVRLGDAGIPNIMAALTDANANVRHVCTTALGILRARPAREELEERLASDPDETVRSQAAVALGQIGDPASLPVLAQVEENDVNRDVRHQCSISKFQIENGKGIGPELSEAFSELDESRFEVVEVGKPAPDFELEDTSGKTWRLSSFIGKKPVVLIWIFADWCPVCHREFRELIRLRPEFEQENLQVFTIECHDRFHSRVMTGEELQPKYWFSKESSPQQSYGRERWWPHLMDMDCSVGAMYGIHPMQYVVHSEWINRPSTVIIDREGVVRLAYNGTFWGDRPAIQDILSMVRSGEYTFEHLERRKLP